MLHISHTTENTHKKPLAVEVLMAALLFSVFQASFTQASDITADNVISLVNKARTSVNQAALVKNDLLQKAAQNKAQDMLDENYFAHVSPQGKSPWFWIEEAGYDYRFAGENLAINYTSAKDEQQAWMDSPLHRKNILNPDYQEIGVAVKEGVIDGHKTTVAVQMFGARNEKKIVNAVAATKPPQPTVKGISLGMKNDPGKKTSEFDLNLFYQKNKPSLIGWLAAVGLALLVLLADVAALLHKRHAQLLILHDARRKQA